MVSFRALALVLAGIRGVLAQNATMNTTTGPALQLEHQFFDQMPTGISLTSNLTMFVNYPIALNSTTQSNSTTVYTLARLTGNTTDTPFPSATYNRPTGGYVNASDSGYSNGDADHLVSVQNVVVDYQDRIWALDTGRPTVDNQMLLSVYGGPKLVAFSQSGQVLQTILFPTSVVFADSYLNDIRFDLRANVTSSGKGIAYITDSSSEGRNGIVVVDLGTGTSWRHLNGVMQVRPDTGFVSSYDGVAFMPIYPELAGLGTGQYSQLLDGSDGIALSADGQYIFFTPLASRRLYRVPTANLRDQPIASNPFAAMSAIGNTTLVQTLASHADGLEMDASGLLYQGAPEKNSIYTLNSTSGAYQVFVSDPRIQWPDTLFVTNNNRLYFTSNQYWHQPMYNNGTDLRQKPYELFSVPISAGRINLQ